MGWALGAILYEINEFPWEYNAITVAYSWFYTILAALIGMYVAVCYVFFGNKFCCIVMYECNMISSIIINITW